MRRSVIALAALVLAFGPAGCSLLRRPKPSKPPPAPLFEARTATLAITNGISILASIALPPGFAPAAGYPPMWLQHGMEIGVAGEVEGKTVVLGFSGAKLANRRVLAQDFGVAAAAGVIVDLAASPDGTSLATAVSQPQNNRIVVFLRDLMSPSDAEGHALAFVDGSFALVHLTWLDSATLSLALRAPAPNTQPNAEPAAAGGAASDAFDGLYLIDLAKPGPPQRFHQPGCTLSRLSWSPNGRLAVAQGDVQAPAALIDLTAQTCQKLNIATPIKLLGWSPDSTAFIYTAPNVDARSVGIFRYELATGASTLVAVSSSAAAYASDGAIIAVVNRELSWRRVAAQPQAKVKIEIAAFDPKQSEIRINSLGFETSAALLAQGSMEFAPASGDAVIDAYLPAMPVPIRELIEYSYPTQSAFVLARGSAQGPVMISWSPDGHMLAIVDSDAQASTLTLMVPPQ
jgi:hypothetical protein